MARMRKRARPRKSPSAAAPLPETHSTAPPRSATRPSGTFGAYLRTRREARRETDADFSVRRLAQRVGVEPSYLSKVERGLEAPPSEEKIRRLAVELGDDPDLLLAMAGKVSDELQRIIRRRPEVFAELLRQLAEAPDHAILRVVREVRDGDW